MRLGFLTYGLDRAPTGIGRYTLELLRAMAVLPGGPEVVLLTTEQDDPHGLWARFARWPLPGARLLPALLTWGNLALARAARRLELDLVHDPNGIAPFLTMPASVRCVVTIHDAFAYVYPHAHNLLDNWRFRWMLPAAARRADAVITDSEHSRSDLLRYLCLPAPRVHTIPCGIDSRFVPVPDGSERRAVLGRYGITRPYLLYVGGINARKNIARLFEAYALVRQRYPELALVVAGKRQWRTAAIDAAFERLELAQHVHFTGYFEEADLPALYSAAEVFVFPSLYEGFGLPPLEALACGTPVVTSAVASLPEVVGDAALTVDPYDVAGLEAAIERALADSALREDLRRRGLARAAGFTWERAAQATLAVYREVLAEPAARRAGVPAADGSGGGVLSGWTSGKQRDEG